LVVIDGVELGATDGVEEMYGLGLELVAGVEVGEGTGFAV
jgi:hypothetical protein